MIWLVFVGQSIREEKRRDAKRQGYKDQLLGLLESFALGSFVWSRELYEDGKRTTSKQLGT